jgi:peptidoglycan/xylan/chitin deacetylase (PgdA/CDA1 family)
MWLCWSAALMIGQGRDPRALLDLLKDDRDPDFDPDSVANQLFQAVLLPQCNTPQAWPSLWPKVEPAIDRFLAAMEAQTGARHLALLARRALIRMICNAWRGAESITIGHAIAQRIEVTQPISDVRAEPGVERLFARIEVSGQHLGNVELPVCDGLVSSRVIADAIAAQHAWTLLRLFFEQTIFPTLKFREGHDGLSIVRGANVLVSGVNANGDDLWPQVHEQIGWLLLLQELWGEPTRPKQWFYEANVHSPANAVQAGGPWQVVETSAPLPAFQTGEAKLHIAACVGGMMLCEVTVESRGGRVEAGALRSAINAASGMELGRAIVREAIVGRAMKDGQSIRQRLAASARHRPSANRIAASDDAIFSPRADQIWARDLVTREENVLAMARWPGPVDSVASRRASLPSACIDEIRAGAQPHLLFRVAPQGQTRVAYAPDLLWLPKGNPAPVQAVRSSPPPAVESDAPKIDRLPILRYQEIAPIELRRQLEFLSQNGYRTISLGEWRAAVTERQPVNGRAVVLAFDDARSFEHDAFPILRKLGFSAHVFVVTDRAGDGVTWDQIRELHGQGIQFGSRTTADRTLTAMSNAEVVRELVRSRATLSRELGGAKIDAIAYPQGRCDDSIAHFAGACGYQFGLTRRNWRASFTDSMLQLPCVEVCGERSFEDFVAAL